MRHSKEIVTAVGTVALAIGIGFVMQSTDSAKQRYGVQPAPPVKTTPLTSLETLDANTGASLADVRDVTLTSAAIPRIPSASGIAIVADHLVSRVAMPKSDRATVSTPTCDIKTSVAEREGAIIDIALKAECLANERLTVHHNGLKFSETTDADGNLEVSVPALANNAVFVFAFANGDGAIVHRRVKSLDDYGRTVLQWRGSAGLQLHAREFGAAYGTTGHIWAGSNTNVETALENQHGFVMQLGNDAMGEPMLAQIYTYPLSQPGKRGTIDLTIEAEVHAQNCGRDIEAQSIELIDGSVRTQDVVLAVPDCDAIGSFLVLNNLVADLQVASR